MAVFLTVASDEVWQVATLATSKLAVLVAVQVLRSDAEEAAPRYYVESQRFDHAEGMILFRLPSPSVNVLGLFVISRLPRSCLRILFWQRGRFIE